VPQEKNDVELAAFLADLRARYLSEVDEALAARYLEAIAREAEAILEQGEPEPDVWRRSVRNRFVRRRPKP
jgi:hypothetical protein